MAPCYRPTIKNIAHLTTGFHNIKGHVYDMQRAAGSLYLLTFIKDEAGEQEHAEDRIPPQKADDDRVPCSKKHHKI